MRSTASRSGSMDSSLRTWALTKPYVPFEGVEIVASAGESEQDPVLAPELSDLLQTGVLPLLSCRDLQTLVSSLSLPPSPRHDSDSLTVQPDSGWLRTYSVQLSLSALLDVPESGTLNRTPHVKGCSLSQAATSHAVRLLVCGASDHILRASAATSGLPPTLFTADGSTRQQIQAAAIIHNRLRLSAPVSIECASSLRSPFSRCSLLLTHCGSPAGRCHSWQVQPSAQISAPCASRP